MPLDRKPIDLSWKICHAVLYMAALLSSFGYNHSSMCFSGFPLETCKHLFFSCPLAKSALDWIQSLLFNACPPAPSLLAQHILFGFNPDELRAVPWVFVYLLQVCKYHIWLQHNDFRFCSVRPSAVSLIASIKLKVKFYLSLFAKRFCSQHCRRFFVRQRGANGLITAARLAQLGERQSTEQEAVSSNPGRTNTQGLQITEEKVLSL